MQRKIIGFSIAMMALVLMGCPDLLTPTTDTIVTLLAIPGVAAPITGATPATTITATDQYTGAISWSPTISGSFAVSTIYTATITLSPKSGYTLTGVAENSFKVDGATSVTHSADSGVVTVVFPTTTNAIITQLAIPGVSAPIIGATPVTTISGTDQYTGTISWSPTVSGAFIVDTAYTATITLSPKSGYTLTGVTANSFTVAGATSVTHSADSGVVTAAFPTTSIVAISQLAIPGVSAPVTGATPATSFEASQYTGIISWSPTVSGTFVVDTAYTATITLSPKPGYTLTGVVENSFTVAGATSVTHSADSGVVTAVFPITMTSLTMTLYGDDASLFKLAVDEYSDPIGSDLVQSSPAIWSFDFTADSNNVLIYAFIDSNDDNVMDENELSSASWFMLDKGIANVESINLCKSIIGITVSGDASIFTHPMLVHNRRQSGSSSLVVAPIQAETIVTYGNFTGANGAGGCLEAFDDLNNNGLCEYNEPTISTETMEWSYSATQDVTIELMTSAPQILPDGEKIQFGIDAADYYPADIQHYRFIFDSEINKIVFVIPVGTGTDGAFITCYQCETDPPRSDWHSGDHYWNLFKIIYENDAEKRGRVMTNYDQQLVELKQNIKDIVTYLEETKGFTVEGKDTLPANW